MLVTSFRTSELLLNLKNASATGQGKFVTAEGSRSIDADARAAARTEPFGKNYTGMRARPPPAEKPRYGCVRITCTNAALRAAECIDAG